MPDDVEVEERARRDDLAELARLAERYRLRAHRMSRTQYLAGMAARRRGNRLGVPVVVLTAAVGTAIFATVSSSPALGWVIAAGLISMLAAALSAVQTFFGFAARAEEHRAAGAKYAGIKRDLDLLLLQMDEPEVTRSDLLAQFAAITDRYGTTDKESPTVPDHLYDQARQEERVDDEGV